MKIAGRLNKIVAAQEDSKENFEVRLKNFLRDAKNKGYIEIMGPIASPRYYEILEMVPGDYVAYISISYAIIDFETIRKMGYLAKRHNVSVSSVEHKGGRWACLSIRDTYSVE